MMHALGAHAGRHDGNTVRNDPRRHVEHRVNIVGAGRGRLLADHHRAPLLARATPARFASAPPHARELLRADAAAGAARKLGPLELNKQLNQRLVQARGEGELLRLRAEYGENFNDVIRPRERPRRAQTRPRHAHPLPQALAGTHSRL